MAPQVTTLQATRSKRAEVDPNGALAHKRKAGTLADIAEVCLLLWPRFDHQGRSACSAAACAGPDRCLSYVAWWSWLLSADVRENNI